MGNIHTLNLSSCSGITDVSMLGNVHTLISPVMNIYKKNKIEKNVIHIKLNTFFCIEGNNKIPTTK